ncbi:hypothetical protein BCR39DRAFT_532414 [Naematelia encephala]|uniref:Beta-lactamase-like protein n=1 Tax=Naematelia encephala TaxID=71784 RepID=A0A1Y2B3E1_9TREE|nr:hypothetical protein BCR39DRAFT_532414 [Naematelia encephala]
MPIELPQGSISAHALDILQADTNLPICTACGTQYPKSVTSCVICEDPRQFVPASGQSWSSLAELGETRTQRLTEDQEDGRIKFIHTEPGFGINQTPILIETNGGSYIWDCAAYISPHLISYLSSLRMPLKAIAISHPHFFSTSLTWSRALRVPLYLCSADKEWFQRLSDITPQDDVRWWTDEIDLGPAVKLIQCGGHFPGSSILHWDRLSESPPPLDNLPTKPTPVSGIILTADTIMVQPTQKRFTFIWSAPNMIPLDPHEVIRIYDKVKYLPFGQASSTWPGRFIRQDAKDVLRRSIEEHARACGWKWDEGNELVPL